MRCDGVATHRKSAQTRCIEMHNMAILVRWYHTQVMDGAQPPKEKYHKLCGGCTDVMFAGVEGVLCQFYSSTAGASRRGRNSINTSPCANLVSTSLDARASSSVQACLTAAEIAQPTEHAVRAVARHGGRDNGMQFRGRNALNSAP